MGHTNVTYLISLSVKIIANYYNSGKTWQLFGFDSKPKKRSFISSVIHGRIYDKERFLKKEILISMISLSLYYIYNLKLGDDEWHINNYGYLIYDDKKHYEYAATSHWKPRNLNLEFLSCFDSGLKSCNIDICEEYNIDEDVNSENPISLFLLNNTYKYLSHTVVAKYNSLSFEIICAAIFLKHLKEKFVEIDNPKNVQRFIDKFSLDLRNELGKYDKYEISFFKGFNGRM